MKCKFCGGTDELDMDTQICAACEQEAKRCTCCEELAIDGEFDYEGNFVCDICCEDVKEWEAQEREQRSYYYRTRGV